MSDLQTILEKIDALTAEEKQQVVAYIQQQEQVTHAVLEKRIPDLFPGIWMSDDFDTELPDSFWLGEE
jgi:hypothetical protein